MTGRTFTQRKAHDFIRAFLLEKGFSPSLAEIAAGIGVKTRASAHAIVHQLAARGLVTVLPGARRSIALARPLHEITVDLPAELDHWVRTLADRTGVTPEAIVIEAVRQGMNLGLLDERSHLRPNPPMRVTA